MEKKRINETTDRRGSSAVLNLLYEVDEHLILIPEIQKYLFPFLNSILSFSLRIQTCSSGEAILLSLG